MESNLWSGWPRPANSLDSGLAYAAGDQHKRAARQPPPRRIPASMREPSPESWRRAKQRRLPAYIGLGVVLVIAQQIIVRSDWSSAGGLHTHLESIATTLAFVVGVLALVRFYSRRVERFLYIGVAFLATGTLDLFHFISATPAAPILGTSDPNLPPWTWLAGRLVLGLLLWASVLDPTTHDEDTPTPVAREWRLYGGIVFVTLLFIVGFRTVTVPSPHSTGFLGRPMDLLPAIPFAAALAGYLKRGRWRTEPFDHWMVLALITSIAVQVPFMVGSRALYDASFDAAHVLKIASYALVVVGTASSLRRLYVRTDLVSAALHEAQSVAAIGSWSWDISSDEILWSDELYRIYGHAPQAFRIDFDRYVSLIDPADRDRVIGVVQTAIETGEDFSFDHRVARPEGERTIVHGRGRILRDETSNTIRLAGTAQDVTARRHNEEALRASEQQFRSVAETAAEAIITIDTDGDVLFWNSGATQMFGHSADAMLGCPVVRILPDTLRGEHEAGMERMRRTGAAPLLGQTVSVFGKKADGSEFPIELSLARWQATEGLRFTAIIRDVTEREEARSRLRAYATRLEASNRELEQFAYVASHDLQEPLRKISAFSDRLAMGYENVLDARGIDYLARMQNAALRMQRLVEDLLSLSRIATRGEPFENVDLDSIVRAVLSDLEELVREKQATVTIGPLPTAHGDPAQLRQLVQNLLTNALKFHPKEQVPKVEIWAERSTRTVEDEPDVSGLVLSVRDNGIGFDIEQLEKILTPFQRLHGRSEYEGTGMGLAICRRIVERHGGQLDAESSPGKGATFRAWLPDDRQELDAESKGAS